jgi:hypothetical protein
MTVWRFMRLGLFVSVAACTIETGHQPTIDSLDGPDTVDVASDGKYHVDPTISYHDPQSEKIVEARITYTSSVETQTITGTIPESDQSSSASTHLSLTFASVLRGDLDYKITVVNAKGDESEPASKHVKLQ